MRRCPCAIRQLEPKCLLWGNRPRANPRVAGFCFPLGVDKTMNGLHQLKNYRPPPCPFCGKVSWGFFRDPGTWATAVECRHCGARGPLCIPSEDEALAAWSERAPVKQEPTTGVTS